MEYLFFRKGFPVRVFQRLTEICETKRNETKCRGRMNHFTIMYLGDKPFSIAYFHFTNYRFLEICKLQNGSMLMICRIEICNLLFLFCNSISQITDFRFVSFVLQITVSHFKNISSVYQWCPFAQGCLSISTKQTCPIVTLTKLTRQVKSRVLFI